MLSRLWPWSDSLRPWQMVIHRTSNHLSQHRPQHCKPPQSLCTEPPPTRCHSLTLSHFCLFFFFLHLSLSAHCDSKSVAQHEPANVLAQQVIIGASFHSNALSLSPLNVLTISRALTRIQLAHATHAALTILARSRKQLPYRKMIRMTMSQ
jgi:hypothetical protein